MTPTVSDIITLLEKMAPPYLAEAWDNCGLQVGQRNWPVKHIRTALDPLPTVVADAVESGVDLLVTHHPLIFKPVKQVDFGREPGQTIRRAAESRLAVYAAHTSLDTAPGGLNDILAGRIGMEETVPLVKAPGEESYKLAFFVPVAHVDTVINVLADAGAGRIGKYSGCTFRTQGRATFIPGPDSDPYTGTRGRKNEVTEARIEALVAVADLEQVVAAVQAVHPYECMAYDVYPVVTSDRQGLGRVGVLKTEMTLDAFASHVAESLDQIGGIRVVGDPHRKVRKAAVCTGSGSSLTGDFLASGADVYVSGDMHYHDARSIEEAGRGLVDIGHFESEQIMVKAVADLLQRQMEDAGYDAAVSTCEVENDPYRYL